MARMYHPALGREVDVPDDPACIAVFEDSGWVAAPAPAPTPPGIVPEPVTYAPVVADAPADAEPEDEAPPAKARRSAKK